MSLILEQFQARAVNLITPPQEELLCLDVVKKHLRIDEDFTEEDDYISDI